jgi:hypothetical protein
MCHEGPRILSPVLRFFVPVLVYRTTEWALPFHAARIGVMLPDGNEAAAGAHDSAEFLIDTSAGHLFKRAE